MQNDAIEVRVTMAGGAQRMAERLEGLPLSHISIEVGHLYRQDLIQTDQYLVRKLTQIRSWLEPLLTVLMRELEPRRTRISTCMLLDEYSGDLASPSILIPRLLGLAESVGLRIDYLAKESGCAVADGIDVAEMVLASIVDEPSVGENGHSAPSSERGWLFSGNGTMSAPVADLTRSPKARDFYHPIEANVELWRMKGDERRWSCAFLATVWQLLRLGMIRNQRKVVAKPARLPSSIPEQWRDLPAVVRTWDGAAPFAAYRAISLLDSRFLRTEFGVQTVLDSVLIDQAILTQLEERAQAERLHVPASISARTGYLFLPSLPG